MRFLLAGNWKMNTLMDDAIRLSKAISDHARTLSVVDVMIAPPFVWLSKVRENLGDGPVALGAQNMHWECEGAYTGEVSPIMLRSIGCRYVILGHSERRLLFGETDEIIKLKVKTALENGLIPILCVGETLEERDAGKTLQVIDRQLQVALQDLKSVRNLVIAYEPVWAIGTGRAAKPEQAGEVHSFIRKKVFHILGQQPEMFRILYGGSVKPDNIASFLEVKDVNGALVGGASLKAESFNAILDVAEGMQT